jgi:hypothetical protein
MGPVKPEKDWNEARPARIPPPTFAPAGVAFGTTLFMWGLLTSFVLIGVGLVVIILSLGAWIGEMRHAGRA